jgi:DNA-binding transcriptional MerR regulator
MGDEELLSIGRFARLAGLSIGALRHYHELGVLVPSHVDPQTAYRSYARAQLDDARLVARLRELELPLPEVRAILGAGAVERRRLLAAHRSRLTALITRTQRQVHWLTQAIDHEEPLMTAPSAPVDVADRRQLAVDLFNHVWTLLERSDRSPLEDDEMLHAAHASRYHWGEVGSRSISTAVNGSAPACTPSLAAPSPPCGMRTGAWRSARSMGSATGTSPSPTRRWRERCASPATMPEPMRLSLALVSWLPTLPRTRIASCC